MGVIHDFYTRTARTSVADTPVTVAEVVRVAQVRWRRSQRVQDRKITARAASTSPDGCHDQAGGTGGAHLVDVTALAYAVEDLAVAER
jgi:sigma54-dependent transcription regulator